MRKMVLCTLASIAMALPALAKPVDVYDCTFANERPFMSPKAIVIHDINADTFQVMDGMINYTHGEPIAAKQSRNDGERLVLTWRIDFVGRGNTTAKLDYRLVFIKKNSVAVASMQAGRYENRETVRGSCTVERQDLSG